MLSSLNICKDELIRNFQSYISSSRVCKSMSCQSFYIQGWIVSFENVLILNRYLITKDAKTFFTNCTCVRKSNCTSNPMIEVRGCTKSCPMSRRHANRWFAIEKVLVFSVIGAIKVHWTHSSTYWSKIGGFFMNCFIHPII